MIGDEWLALIPNEFERIQSSHRVTGTDRHGQRDNRVALSSPRRFARSRGATLQDEVQSASYTAQRA
jgi:hypothetical protein